MSTFAVLKRKTANRLGRTDNATANTIRDNCIIDAVSQIVQERKWSWTLKEATLTVADGVSNLPFDYNPSMGLIAFHEVSGTANDKEYTRVDLRDLDLYTTSEYVYYITYDTTNRVYVFNSNQTTDTVKIFYHFVPAELSDDTDNCLVPDDMAVVYLAAAMWWLAKERDETNYDRFYQKYQERLNMMINQDAANNATRTQLKSKLDDDDRESILSTQR